MPFLLKSIPEHEIDVIFDYELWPTRRPKIIMQTVGHISGATHFYSRQQLKNDPFPKDQVMGNRLDFFILKILYLEHDGCMSSS